MHSVAVDVLILGGGPAGSTAARTLASAGASVVLAERSDYGLFRVGETLPPETNVVLASAGLAASLGEPLHLPSPGTVAAWGRNEPHENDFIFSPYGHGWHLDRRRFDRSLVQAAAEAGAELILNARAVACDRVGGNRWTVVLAVPGRFITVSARWVIDASGRAGWFVRAQGVAKHKYDRLIAVLAVLEDGEPSDPRTFIEAMRDGWWYVAALPGARTMAAYFTDADLHDLRPGAAEAFWSDRLGASRLAKERLACSRRTSELQIASCATRKAAHSGGAGWLAVGDAACAIDPLSSQGITWAVVSGRDAARAVLDADADAARARYEFEWAARFRDYLTIRRRYYTAEGRWPDAPFWRRRSMEPAPFSQSIRSFGNEDHTVRSARQYRRFHGQPHACRELEFTDVQELRPGSQ